MRGENFVDVPTQHVAPSIRTVALASAIEATIEWYDFFLYGVVTPLVLNKLFFPNFDPVVGTLLAYTTFFVGGIRVGGKAPWHICAYVLVVSIISALSILAMREMHTRDMALDHRPA